MTTANENARAVSGKTFLLEAGKPKSFKLMHIKMHVRSDPPLTLFLTFI